MTNAKMPELPKPDVFNYEERCGIHDEGVSIQKVKDYGQACWDAANEAALARVKELEAKLKEANSKLDRWENACNSVIYWDEDIPDYWVTDVAWEQAAMKVREIATSPAIGAEGE